MLSVEEYKACLVKIRDSVRERDYAMLRAQYVAPHRKVTAPELAGLLGLESYRPINRWYGELGRLFSDASSKRPRQRRNGTFEWWMLLSYNIPSERKGGFRWTMHPELAQAMEELGIVMSDDARLAEEVNQQATYREGSTRQILVNAYERNAAARQACVNHYGARCVVCNFDFGDVYGEIGRGFIHVHHLCPLADVVEEYHVNPVADLRPVCPNCHAIIHRRNPPYSIDEVQKLLSKYSI